MQALADSLDPDTAQVESTDDLREIATAAEAVRADDVRLREAVVLARAHGRSWNHIALALGYPDRQLDSGSPTRQAPDNDAPNSRPEPPWVWRRWCL